MKDNSLLNFYRDTETRDNVYYYLIDFLKDEAIRKVFSNEEVFAIAEAKDIIDKAWENMGIMFEAKPKKRTINNSR